MMRSGEVYLDPGYLAKEPAASRPIVYLAVLDELGGSKYHDVMAEVLDTCVKGLPDDCRFGVVTASDGVGLVDLAAPLPHVQFVDMGFDRGGGDTSVRRRTGTVSLSDVMSLEELVCPLGGNRGRISANLRRLGVVCRGADAASPGHVETRGTHATGLAVKLLLDLILGSSGTTGNSGAVGLANPNARPSPRRSERGNGHYRNTPPTVKPGGKGFAFAGCRLMLFLAAPPDVGPGAVGPGSASSGQGQGKEGKEGYMQDRLFRGESRALVFYRGQAYRAASSGVSVDVHCFASEACGHFGLSSMAPLAMTTGGGVFRHSLLHQRDGEDLGVTLGNEVCAELLRPRVYDGLLRVRTSAEFAVNRDGVYGNLSADPRLENLWHVASCSSGQSFAMDFEFRVSGVGAGAVVPWEDDVDTSSTVQSAFAYTAVVPDTDFPGEGRRSGGEVVPNGTSRSSNGGGGGGTNAARMVTVRRLRVTTVRTGAYPSVKEVASMADPAAVATVLTHKVVSEARRSGFAEARALLRDWLANFVYGLSQNLAPPSEQEGSSNGVGDNIEVKMGRLMTDPLVMSMARLVFGLLQSPLLHPTEGVADERVSLLSRLSTLDADSLSLVLYPEMQGYATPNVRVANSLSLSREVVKEASSACRIFVVDTFWKIIVHYADSPASLATNGAAVGRGGGEALPFPPPKDSAIGQFLELRRAVRPMAGQEVVCSRPGTREAYFFEQALIEDRQLPTSEGGQNFQRLLSDLVKDVVRD
ncbi:unnamed protein product [Ascophyllum nodosum]